MSDAHATRIHLFVVSGPSGVGKSTLVQAVLNRDEALKRAITHTSREPRGSEINGVHYHFVSESEFLEMKARDEFLESVHIFGNYYGTSRRAVEKNLEEGIDTVLVIDWQGAQNVRRIFDNVTSVFILPPSIAALHRRLEERASVENDFDASRTLTAREEMSHCSEYDYVLENALFDTTVEDLHEVVEQTRLNRRAEVGLSQDLIASILADS